MIPMPEFRLPDPDPELFFAYPSAPNEEGVPSTTLMELPDSSVWSPLGRLRLDPAQHSALKLQLQNGGAASDSDELTALYWNDLHTIGLVHELLESRRFKMPVIAEIQKNSDELLIRDGSYRVVAARRAWHETGDASFSTLPVLISTEPINDRARGDWIVRALVQARPALDDYESACVMRELATECGLAPFEIAACLRLELEEVECRIDSAHSLERFVALDIARKEIRLIAFQHALARCREQRDADPIR